MADTAVFTTVFNPFRYAGDLVHILSIVLLLHKIRTHRSCSGMSCLYHIETLFRVIGISLKTQLLYAAVFTSRYLDLFTNYLWIYNIVLKVLFLTTSYATIYLIVHKYRATYDKEHDTFQIIYLVGPASALALLFTDEYSITEVFGFERYVIYTSHEDLLDIQYHLGICCHSSSGFPTAEDWRS